MLPVASRFVLPFGVCIFFIALDSILLCTTWQEAATHMGFRVRVRGCGFTVYAFRVEAMRARLLYWQGADCEAIT